MTNIMERISADNITTYTARICSRVIAIKRQHTPTLPRITDVRVWIQKTESFKREGKYFSQDEAKRHTFADMTERYIKTVLPNKSAKVRSQYAQQLRKWSSWLGEQQTKNKSGVVIPLNPKLLIACKVFRNRISINFLLDILERA